MSTSWTRRAVTVFVIWVVVYAVSAAADTDPQPVLLAALIVLLASVLWLATDLADHVVPAKWETWTMSLRSRRGADVRVGVLQRALSDVATRQDVDRLHPVLVALVDDRLAAHHGIDRTTDASRAATVLGPELSDFVRRAPSPVQLGSHVYLSSVLDRIEQL